MAVCYFPKKVTAGVELVSEVLAQQASNRLFSVVLSENKKLRYFGKKQSQLLRNGTSRHYLRLRI